jgi:hypothetical protein
MYIRYLRKIFTLSVFDTVQKCIYNIAAGVGARLAADGQSISSSLVSSRP